MSVQVPKKWGMKTPSKDRSMETTAYTLLDRIERARAYSQKVIAFEHYCRCYGRRCLAQSTKEAASDEVRRRVSAFVEEVGEYIGLKKTIAQDIFRQNCR